MNGNNQPNQNSEVIFPKHWPPIFTGPDVEEKNADLFFQNKNEISYYLAITPDIKHDRNNIVEDLKSLHIKELECEGQDLKEDLLLNLHSAHMPVSYSTLLDTLNGMSELDLSKYKIIHLPLNCHVLESAILIGEIKKILQSKNQLQILISVQLGHFYFTRFDYWNNHLRQCFAIMSAMIGGVDRFVLYCPNLKNDSTHFEIGLRRNIIRSALTAPRVLQEETDILNFNNVLNGSEIKEFFLKNKMVSENLEEDICQGKKIITGVNQYIDNTLEDQKNFSDPNPINNKGMSFLDRLEKLRISWMGIQKRNKIVVHVVECEGILPKIFSQRKIFLENFLAFSFLEFSFEKMPSKGNLLFIIGDQLCFKNVETQYDQIVLVSGIEVKTELNSPVLVINQKVRIDHFWTKILEYYNK